MTQSYNASVTILMNFGDIASANYLIVKTSITVVHSNYVYAPFFAVQPVLISSIFYYVGKMTRTYANVLQN